VLRTATSLTGNPYAVTKRSIPTAIADLDAYIQETAQ
jgi:hypothetical protein